MLKLLAYIQAYKNNEDGATAIEYGLLAAFISLAIIAAVIAFGDSLVALFDRMATALDGAGT